MNNKKPRLEIFPDELFLDLFSYIPPVDLFRVWCGLNRRISAIIRSIRISFDLNEYTDANIRALDYFSKQIVFLHLHISYRSLDLTKYSNLRSLIINTQLTIQQLNSIQPVYLPFLRRLAFSKWSNDDEIINDIIFNQDSSTVQAIPWLKVYHLPKIPNYFIGRTLALSHINTMIFDRVTPFDISLILYLQPTLRRLKITIVRWMFDDFMPKFFLHDKNFQHKNLHYLEITMNTCNRLDDLYPLLQHLPCLRSLYIACDSLTLSDFKRLAIELVTRTPYLRKFNCSFKQTYIESIEVLQNMSPLFRHMKCRKIEWTGGWHYYCVTTVDI